MCWCEKVDLWMWINLDGFDQRLLLCLRLTADKKGYEDRFTIERPVEGGRGTEVLFTLPFDDISEISYIAPGLKEDCTVSIDMAGDDRFKRIKVSRHCFNALEFRKMIRLHKKSKQKAKA